MKDFNATAAEIGALVTAKNEAYGDSFAKCGEFLRLLYPEGIQPPQYDDALAMVRIFDKQMRIATRKDAFGESPYRDIAGYGILGAVKDTPPHDGEGSDLYLHGNLCPSCQRKQPCKGDYPATKDGGCEGYITTVPLTLCSTCERNTCNVKGLPTADGRCDGYIKAERKASLCHSCGTDVPCHVERIKACEDTGTCDRYTPALRERMLDAASPCDTCATFPCDDLGGKAVKCSNWKEKAAEAKQDAPKTAELAPTHTDPATNCKDCGNTACKGIGRNVTCDQGCERFEPKGVAL